MKTVKARRFLPGGKKAAPVKAGKGGGGKGKKG
jgi:hypothetical protein